MLLLYMLFLLLLWRQLYVCSTLECRQNSPMGTIKYIALFCISKPVTLLCFFSQCKIKVISQRDISTFKLRHTEGRVGTLTSRAGPRSGQPRLPSDAQPARPGPFSAGGAVRAERTLSWDTTRDTTQPGFKNHFWMFHEQP